MSIKTRLEKLEEAHGKGSSVEVEYVVDSWDDYYRVRSELGRKIITGLGRNVFIEMNKPEEERREDTYRKLLSKGRLVETCDFKQMGSRNQVNAFIKTHLGGSGALPEF